MKGPALYPTAVHDVAEVHETPLRSLLVAPLGFGVVWIVQLLPSQRSASVVPGAPVLEKPTAVQAAADVHETPLREAAVAPLGLGVV
jgi:hypothetical protein